MIIKGELTRFLKRPEGDGNGFALASYEAGGSLQPTKIGGPFGPLNELGQWFSAEGYWKPSFYKEKKEMIFQAKSILPALPDTPEGAMKFLTTSFTAARHGIGLDALKKAAGKNGRVLIDAAFRDPSHLVDLSADPAAFKAIIEADWKKITEPIAPLRMMQSARIDDARVARAYSFYQDKLMRVIQENPYDLTMIKDFPFEEADKLGRRLGIDPNDRRRIVAALRTIVTTNGTAGHTSTPVKIAVDSLKTRDIEELSVNGLLEYNDRGKGVVFSMTNGITAHTPAYLDAEMAIARRVTRLILQNDPDPSVDDVTKEILAQSKYAKFDDIQKNAVIRSSKNQVAILTGGPGTGKSTVTEAIAEIAERTSQGPVLLMAPTGKAARRLEETTGRKASTVHRALGAMGSDGKAAYKHNADNPLPAGCFVIVDEASMLDVEVASALFDALPSDGKILLVGDRHQLPSVGAGYVLGDLIAAQSEGGVKVPCSELLNVYRTDKKSKIATYAAEVREGRFDAHSIPSAMAGGVIMYDSDDSTIKNKIVNLVRNAVPKSLKLNPKEVAVLAPQRQGRGGTHELNTALSLALNPNGQEIPDMPAPEKGVPAPRVGDRIMLTVNDYENDVMNGDIGEIVGTFKESISSGRPKTMVKVLFDTGQEVDYPVWKCRDLVLSYAITGHKSQGSQYRCVIMPVSTAHAAMLDRTLVYTEMTRSKEYLIMVGDRGALQSAVENVSSSQRMTSLDGLLGHGLTHALKENASDALAEKPPAPTNSPARPKAPIFRRPLMYRNPVKKEEDTLTTAPKF